MARRPSPKAILIALALLAAAAAAWLLAGGWPKPEAEQPPEPRLAPLGLFTSLPVYWGEAASLSDMLDPGGEPHWARATIERRRELKPLDVLSPEALAGFADLLIAQPRALAPAENVALDGWVRGGGRLLLFADPLLTEQSRFALGDSRRPQDVALLSPILARWGLALQFDETQPAGEHEVALLGGNVPVDLPGRFALAPTAPDAPAQCTLLAQGLAAECAIGKGRALILADAALLDRQGADPAARGEALSRLMAEAYAPR